MEDGIRRRKKSLRLEVETHKQMENERENTVFNEDITLAAATEKSETGKM
jgi:hypothetical protein